MLRLELRTPEALEALFEPMKGFEPPTPSLQVRCSDQLSYIGMERDRLFIPLKDSLRPFEPVGGFEPPTSDASALFL